MSYHDDLALTAKRSRVKALDDLYLEEDYPYLKKKKKKMTFTETLYANLKKLGRGGLSQKQLDELQGELKR